jgi:hypothetical protein
MFWRQTGNKAGDLLLRTALMVIAFAALFCPDDRISAAIAAFVLAAIIFGVARHRRIAPPPGPAGAAGGLAGAADPSFREGGNAACRRCPENARRGARLIEGSRPG